MRDSEALGRAEPAAALSPGGGADPDLVRRALRHHAKGVAVVTAGVGRPPVGFCATSVTSLSLAPPLMSFTVGLRSASWPVVEGASHVMVHLLAAGQESVARVFGGAGRAKFGPDTRWRRGAHGLPVLDGVLARLALAPVDRLLVSDHALVIGRVTRAWHAADGRPLVHHDGGYVRLSDALALTAGEE
ncbi:p-hydroxyphenylacetate 3-hydroxylase, reductase component [Streptomyces sp. YIM 121038]|uniref:flavin reductase family protein n=1 Tax=Streptomyces sp. YIM 121038 TaxID=2136401 RepID=UPI001164FD02|nr:flavin reductase family protein [Streptomyces sp. YIM 121038]QCX81596.1 p-hydroxyphenylacetate 3-hydroxylase, reductase component [Streptomyces sp. YIM 121038]